MKYYLKIIIIIFIASAFIFFLYFFKGNNQTSKIRDAVIISPANNKNTDGKIKAVFSEPISNASLRATKKTFGLFVSPKNSPVQPERFTGFHTGTDFETNPSEQNIDVPIFAICGGPLILKKYASGYGGVAVQKCEYDGNAITVVYGHLKLSSIATKINDQIKSGTEIGILGKGYSTETDGEKKHLHLAIHKGEAINLLGYVQKNHELEGWIDPLPQIAQ